MVIERNKSWQRNNCLAWSRSFVDTISPRSYINVMQCNFGKSKWDLTSSACIVCTQIINFLKSKNCSGKPSGKTQYLRTDFSVVTWNDRHKQVVNGCFVEKSCNPWKLCWAWNVAVISRNEGMAPPAARQARWVWEGAVGAHAPLLCSSKCKVWVFKHTWLTDWIAKELCNLNSQI